MLSHRLIAFIICCVLSIHSWADREVSSLQKRLAQAAEQYRRQQGLCIKTEERLKNLEWEKTQKTARLEKQVVKINTYLSALQKVKLVAPTAILSSAMTPERLVQSTIMLNAFIRHILSSTEALRAEISQLTVVKSSIEREKLSAKKMAERYNEKHKEVETLLKERRKTLKQEIQQRKKLEQRINHLARESTNLHELIQRIEGSQRKAAKRASARTSLHYTPTAIGYGVKPVMGPVISSFGKKHPGMDTEGTGLVFQVPGNALVYAPTNATVAYAGPFRKYNQILILSHHGKYHTLLIGLEEVEVSVGQTVLAGEPVGYTAPKNPSHVYVELRENEKPVDPTPWFKGL